mgnify:CR=1 FL=1
MSERWTEQYKLELQERAAQLEANATRLEISLFFKIDTSFDPANIFLLLYVQEVLTIIYILTYYIEWVTFSWTHSNID